MNLKVLAVVAATVFSIMTVPALCCPGVDDIGANCKCMYEKVSCSCLENKELNLTFENMDFFAPVVSLFLLENCTSQVTVNEHVLLNLFSLESVVFRNIASLVVHSCSLEFFSNGMVKFQDVDKLILHPDSIVIPGDAMTNVTVVNSNVAASWRSQERSSSGKRGASGQSDTFKCNSNSLYWLVDNEHIPVMQEAVKCADHNTFECEAREIPNGSPPDAFFSLFTVVLGLVFAALYN